MCNRSSLEKISQSLMSIKNESNYLMPESQMRVFGSIIQAAMMNQGSTPLVEGSEDFPQILLKLFGKNGYPDYQGAPKERIMDWDEWFFEMAKTAATKSKVPGTKAGCVIAGPDHELRATGYNGLPRGVDDYREDWYDQPINFNRLVKAEANAVANASFTGTSLRGGIAYSTMPPGPNCAGLLINAGVVSMNFLVPLDADPKDIDPSWKAQFMITLEIFKEAGVSVIPASGTWDENGDDPLEPEVRRWIHAVKSSPMGDLVDPRKEEHAYKGEQIRD